MSHSCSETSENRTLVRMLMNIPPQSTLTLVHSMASETLNKAHFQCPKCAPLLRGLPYHKVETEYLEHDGMNSQLSVINSAGHKRRNFERPPFETDHEEAGNAETDELTPPPQSVQAPPTPGLVQRFPEPDEDEEDEGRGYGSQRQGYGRTSVYIQKTNIN